MLLTTEHAGVVVCACAALCSRPDCSAQAAWPHAQPRLPVWLACSRLQRSVPCLVPTHASHACASLLRQEITAEDIAKLTARPATAGEDGEEGEEGSRGSSGSEAGDAPQQTQQDQQQEQAQQAQHEEQPQQEAEEQQAQQQQQEAAAEGAAEGAAGSGDESGDEGGAPDADAAPADDAAEVAALLKEENVEALADEERDKLTQANACAAPGSCRGRSVAQ